MATDFTLAAEGKIVIRGDFSSSGLPAGEKFVITWAQTTSPYTEFTVGFGYRPPSGFNGNKFEQEIRLPAGTYTIATDAGARRLRFRAESGGDYRAEGFTVL